MIDIFAARPSLATIAVPQCNLGTRGMVGRASVPALPDILGHLLTTES